MRTPSSTGRPSSPTLGFTLVELRLVISVIALLIGILLPALAKARAAAAAARSLSNAHQIALGISLYATDNAQHPPTVADSGFTWMEHIGLPAIDPGNAAAVANFTRYVSDPNAFRSPLDQTAFWTVPDPGGGLRHTSYGLNGYFAYDLPPYFGVTFDQVQSPSQAILIAEYDDAAAYEDHFHPVFFGYDPAQPSPQSVAMGLVDAANVPYPGPAFAQVMAAGGTQGSSGPGFIDNSDDAVGAWDPATKLPRMLALTRFGGKAMFGFADAHAATHAFAETFQWTTYSPSAWTAPEVNWYDPKGR